MILHCFCCEKGFDEKVLFRSTDKVPHLPAVRYYCGSCHLYHMNFEKEQSELRAEMNYFEKNEDKIKEAMENITEEEFRKENPHLKNNEEAPW